MDLAAEEAALGRWPRRLLHVPTLTSYKWQPGNIYGSHVSPLYNAITYTWGRWRLGDDEKPDISAIPVKGVDWEIPRIDPECFTADGLLTLLQRSTEPSSSITNNACPSVEFVWLDIACIDQRGEDPRSAAEIGRQAVIFQGAKAVFMWLSSLSHFFLRQQIFEPLDRFVDRLSKLGLSDQALIGTVELEQARDCLVWLFRDPWFSSLWTLQEAFLRWDAVILSKEAGSFVYRHLPQHDMTLADLLGYGDALMFPEVIEHGLPEPYSEMVQLFQRTGLANVSQTLAACTSSKYRTCTRDEDRVYGIQQVFGIRVGKSSPLTPPGSFFTRAQLELLFGEQLLLVHPVLSQMHVFTSPAPAGRAWLFSAESELLHDLDVSVLARDDVMDSIREGEWPMCQLSVRWCSDQISPYGHFEGYVCAFSKFMASCMTFENSPIFDGRSQDHSVLGVYLDTTTALSSFSDLPNLGRSPLPRGPAQRALAHRLSRFSREMGDDFVVLLLGKRTAVGRPVMVGLLLLRHRMNSGIIYWHRLGFCSWDLYYVTPNLAVEHAFLTGKGNDWVQLSGLFG